MSSDGSIHFCHKYKPIFRKARTRYKVITGGRGSAKSFTAACGLLLRTYEDSFNILFTRWTMDSAKDSVIPEFKDKMKSLQVEGHFKEWLTSVQNVGTGAKVLFRGLKKSSNNAVAKMKSLFGIKIWVLDEAQELVDEDMFDTIDNSIREANATNEVWLILNPTDINHWIYRRFFLEAGVTPGFNGIKGNVEYIHTTYHDNAKNLDEGFIQKAEDLKLKNPEKYGNIYMGEWLTHREGLIYTNWEEIQPEDYPIYLEQWYGNDWGYGGDPNALLRMCYDPLTCTVYLWEVCCRQLIPSDVFRYIRDDAREVWEEQRKLKPKKVEQIEDTSLQIRYIRDDAREDPEDDFSLADYTVYCDPARPDNIIELRRRGVSAVKAINRDKAGRISYLKGFRVKFVGENIRKEVTTYSWQTHPQDAARYTDKPQDGNDHCMDAASYGAVTHLRRLGILNDDGEA